jgi:hypothetical protein
MALGMAAAVAATRLVEGILFGVSGNDPWTIAGAALIFSWQQLSLCRSLPDARCESIRRGR